MRQVFQTQIRNRTERRRPPVSLPLLRVRSRFDEFTTPEQMEFVKAITMNHVSNEIHRMLKRMEFDHKPRGAFGIGISMKVTGGPQRFHYSYREKELETDVVCDQ